MQIGTTETKYPITDLHAYEKNPRRGDIAGIAESLETNGQFRPIIVRKETKEILAGNHTWFAAQKLGWETISVTFLEGLTDAEALRIVLADNRYSDRSTYDDEMLAELLGTIELPGTGYTPEDISDLLDQITPDEPPQDNSYTNLTLAPQYEIVGPQPKMRDLLDTSKSRELTKKISEANLPDDLKEFLTAAAQRHNVFNYARIAEYYPHCTPEVQRLFEQSALIIIDIGDAVALGYANWIDDAQAMKEDSANDN